MQLVWVTPRDGSGPWVSLDMDPRHYPVHLSYEAALFDAPGPNPPRRNERWEAQTYLMACPDVCRSPAVFPLLGVRWGYDLVDGVVAARPPGGGRGRHVAGQPGLSHRVLPGVDLWTRVPRRHPLHPGLGRRQPVAAPDPLRRDAHATGLRGAGASLHGSPFPGGAVTPARRPAGRNPRPTVGRRHHRQRGPQNCSGEEAAPNREREQQRGPEAGHHAMSAMVRVTRPLRVTGPPPKLSGTTPGDPVPRPRRPVPLRWRERFATVAVRPVATEFSE